MPDSYLHPPSLASPSLVRHEPERHDRKLEEPEQVLARGHRPVPKRDEKLGANGLPRRRNGKQQACEPCRKAKIACDHVLPVCERCRRRKVVEKCVYLKAVCFVVWILRAYSSPKNFSGFGDGFSRMFY
jgi:hypothetical protein